VILLCKLLISPSKMDQDEWIDATVLGKLCKQTEGKAVPFDQIQAALSVIKPANKGELTKEEFIRVKIAENLCFFNTCLRSLPFSEERL
jgi:hypothetical protein